MSALPDSAGTLFHVATPVIYPGNVVDRFVAKVTIVDDADSCWPWTGSRKSPPGLPYGFFTIGRHSDARRVRLAHRVAWELSHGSTLDDGAVVRHRCDNASCVRPSHLVAGTQADNIADTVSRGRQSAPRGEESPHHKLTEADVIAIRASTGSNREIADRFNVSHYLIGDVRRGKSWRHVTRRMTNG